MPMISPTPGDVHVNGTLTNLSLAYQQAESNFVADRVFPNVPVTKQSDIYWVWPRDAWNRDEMKHRAPGAESAGGGFDMGPGGPPPPELQSQLNTWFIISIVAIFFGCFSTYFGISTCTQATGNCFT